MTAGPRTVKARRLGLDAQSEAIVLLHRDSAICRSEGFSAHTRVQLRARGRIVVATLLSVISDLIAIDEAALSEAAWTRLALSEGDTIMIEHLDPVDSLSVLRSRIFGHVLNENGFRAIIGDIVAGRYSSIHIASFLTACAAPPLDEAEIFSLTRAMVDAGERLFWPQPVVVDKHSVGGLPGNRTTPIIVAIVTALGLTMPKTSSRAITSPAGTADMMETLAPVELSAAAIRHVVEAEGGCIAWGGAVQLSPADDILIRVERALDLDTQGQMIASVMSKKIAAGATHLVLDVPVGTTAKVRTAKDAEELSRGLLAVARDFGITARVVIGSGDEPVGRGIGPALEAQDVLAVLQRRPDAPADLRERAVRLAGVLIELAGLAPLNAGGALAMSILDNGRAWHKFQHICEAQGGMRTPPTSSHRQILTAPASGRLTAIDNRKIARLAKLAGAPEDRAAGVELLVRIGQDIKAGHNLCVVHAEAPGELDYALAYAAQHEDIFGIES
ncbi:MAG: thymidine phosphorylase family protein [Proteobacteria bacterium]|nr:thymidine phosphorylase family protein [Pseudomonadota bacterium]